ncbi:hypothetical protein HX870_28950 [Pseudomonas gingeri]|uniref:Uncharacterized protein n=1 Tax=Pseudomonas gingeri TaxID=117681 RepID=A0A7Y7XBJ0_9PSED|nr:hypothetical protein [Pseudomonas gingeri]NWB96580.1 hypothetical protein [Pseudomonas gingeri]NWD71640.1 hypothetical protein [Pseudomonas gingeri]NWD74769.1 hypothetical protein [Pseudomonas gingeri]
MTAVRAAERAYRNWSSPILLELKEREHQLDPSARMALSNVLQERRLLLEGVKPSAVVQPIRPGIE